jgi:hypothetical protein
MDVIEGTINAQYLFTVKPYISGTTEAAVSEVFNIQAHFKLMFEILQYVEVPIM